LEVGATERPDLGAATVPNPITDHRSPITDHRSPNSIITRFAVPPSAPAAPSRMADGG
jgi:hypothetical protein